MRFAASSGKYQMLITMRFKGHLRWAPGKQNQHVCEVRHRTDVHLKKGVNFIVLKLLLYLEAYFLLTGTKQDVPVSLISSVLLLRHNTC